MAFSVEEQEYWVKRIGDKIWLGQPLTAWEERVWAYRKVACCSNGRSTVAKKITLMHGR